MPLKLKGSNKDNFMDEKVALEETVLSFFPTRFGNFKLYVFKNRVDGIEHVALTTEQIGNIPLVRVQSECLTGEVLESLRCDCGFQLKKAMQLIADSKNGVLIYLRSHEGRGIGLTNKVRAYALQDEGFDTVTANNRLGFEADLRDYSVGVAILKKLGIETITLLTNNLKKIEALENGGIIVKERLPLHVPLTRYNSKYLQTKKEKLGHLIDT